MILNMEFSLMLYVFVFLTSSFFLKLSTIFNGKSYYKKFFFLLSIIIPSLLAAFRNGVGTDYHSYEWLFIIDGTSSLKNVLLDSEPIFAFLNYFVYRIGGNYTILLFIISFVTHLFVFLSIKNFVQKYEIVAALIWFLILYLPSFNIMRQILAVSIILYSFRYILSNKYLKFVLFVLVASLIHNISILCLLFLLLPYYNRKITMVRSAYFFLFLITLPILASAFQQVYSGISQNFTYQIKEMGVSYLNLLRVLPVIIPVFFFQKDIMKINKKYEVFINIKYTEVILRPILASVQYGFRIFYYFNCVDIILVPTLLRSIKRKEFRFLLLIYYVLYYLFMFYFNFVINKNDDVFPYIFK